MKTSRMMPLAAVALLTGLEIRAEWDGLVTEHPWRGRTVAFLGDSITDPRHIGTSRNYWQDLGDWLQLDYRSFGENGQKWPGVRAQAERALDFYGDRLDALFVFMGTNDYIAGVPLGEWYVESEKEAGGFDGTPRKFRHRELNLDTKTFRGRINVQMQYLKERFPLQQIVLMTPVHRAFATFGPKNVQQDETYANSIGLFVDAYVAAIKEAANVWAVPVIDLHALSGLYPLAVSHGRFFANPGRDLLHPSAAGHERMARTIYAQLLALPPNFKPSAPADDTAKLQRRIDEVSAAGGGKVTVAPGDYEVRGLELKSNVTLELAKGARILATTNWADCGCCPDQPKRIALVWACGVTNVALVGEGELNGRGWSHVYGNNKGKRLKLCFFHRVKNVRVEGVTLRDPGSWTCYFRECEDVVARKVTIRSMANYNGDGIDIDAKRVLVEDCDIVSEDDAICFKSDNPDFIVEDCTVRNCRLSSNCNFIKFGTSCYGGFRNCRVYGCEVSYKAEKVLLDRRQLKYGPYVYRELTGSSAVAIENPDGGIVENIVVSNITIGAGVQCPLFIRMQGRHAPPAGRTPVLRDVLVCNLKGTAAHTSRIAASITGLKDLRPQNIVLRDFDLVFPGGGTAEEAADLNVPEREKAYPDHWMFLKPLPAHAFYIRHADGIRFENVRTRLAAPDARPACYEDDTTGVTFENCHFASKEK